MGTAIRTNKLSKNFRSKVKKPGLRTSVEGLFKPEWKNVKAVADLNLEIETGDMLAFIGPNGAGKSTTIKMLTGILYPDTGDISVLGLDPHKNRRELAYRIGTVFGQKSQLWFHLPPGDTFRLLGSIYDIDSSVREKRIDYLTEVFELSELLNVPTRKLSLGQRIRCEIAASLIHEPEILFLDEPSIGLDIIAKKRLRSLIRRINEDSGVTVFLTSHDAGDIERIGRRAVVISEGRSIWEGTVKELKYSLLNTRIIDIKLAEPNPVIPEMKGVKLLKEREWSLKLEINLDETDPATVISGITRMNTVADITVKATPLEDIIERVYKGDLGGGSV